MNPIGGEIAIKSSPEISYLTDSGRSSLRVLFRDPQMRNKKILIPNYFCGVIEDVLKEEKLSYAFYSVKDDLSIDQQSLEELEFDVLYIINYFGLIQDLSALDLSDKILLEDNVFLYNFENHHQAKKWFAFNSYRKISPLTDGSLIKTNLSLEVEINSKSAVFAKVKNQACQLKYEYLQEGSHIEDAYLSLFNEGEKMLDMQKDIHAISASSLALLFKEDFNKQDVLKKRFQELQGLSNSWPQLPIYFSYFPLKVGGKKTFLEYMRSKKIFLPNLWPETTQNNNLYTNLVAIPLFNNYTNKEFDYLLENIRIFLKNDE